MKKRFSALLLILVLLSGSARAATHLSFGQAAAGSTELGLAARLTRAFMSIAASSVEEAYCLWVSGNLDVRVTDQETGEYLSSKPGERKSGCGFGYLSNVGDTLDQKLILFVGSGKTVTFQGSGRGSAGYQLLRLNSGAVGEEILLEKHVEADPALFIRLTLQGGTVWEEEVPFEPLRIGELSPFNGAETRGSETVAYGKMKKSGKLLSGPGEGSAPLMTLKEKTTLDVLARSEAGDMLLVAVPDEERRLCRGWLPASLVTLSGEVPTLWPLGGSFTVSGDSPAYQAPSLRAAPAGSLSGGEAVELLFAERDFQDREWAYVRTQVKGKECCVYVPAETLDGWIPLTPAGFRIGYRTPEYQWDYTLGSDGYTEFMCVQPVNGGNGTVLSGRTTSKKSDFPTARGGMDALVVKLDPEGQATGGRTLGGSDRECFHWILPDGDSYYVAGYTRSNDKDFGDIWSPASHTNKSSSKTSSSLALIGRLDEDLEPEWLTSFGTGDKNRSFGFDMVIELADGNLAGCGWMYESKNSPLEGHGHQDFYLVKMTKAGELLDMVSLGSGYQDVPDSAVPTPDGGLIMVGSIRSGSSPSDGLIIIADANLNTVKTVTYGGEGEDTFDNIRPLKDGTFIVTGFTSSVSGSGVGQSHGGYDFWVMNIDDQGRSIWSRRFGGSGNEELCGTTILPDGSCVLLGSTDSDDGDVRRGLAAGSGKDAWAACISDTGRLLWQFVAGTKSTDAFNAAGIDPSDGGLVLGGMIQNKSDKNAVGYAVKLAVPEQERDDPDSDTGDLALFAPMDVVLVLDVSGSMADQNPQTGKTLLSYAQDASISFSRTLFALSPESRIGVVAYDDTAQVVADLSGKDARQALYTRIRAMSWGGMTNTGGGFALADDLLTREAIPDRPQLVLMLTDGLANAGEGDPIQYAIRTGTALAQHSLVYTVGMLGNAAAGNLDAIRATLNAGYETRYFEVTFKDLAE